MTQQQIATAFKCDMNMLPRLASAGVVRAYKRQVLYGVTIPAPPRLIWSLSADHRLRLVGPL